MRWEGLVSGTWDEFEVTEGRQGVEWREDKVGETLERMNRDMQQANCSVGWAGVCLKSRATSEWMK